jgi:plasmid stabilization system protein ParE
MHKLSFKPTAAKEYKDTIEWYSETSKSAAQKFIQAIEDKLYSICNDPQKYKNPIRATMK